MVCFLARGLIIAHLLCRGETEETDIDDAAAAAAERWTLCSFRPVIIVGEKVAGQLE